MADRTVTVKSSGGDYTSLNAALSGESADLVANTRILTIECYNFADTTAASTGTGYTTSASYYIKIIAVDNHGGVYPAAAYRLERTTGICLTIAESYTRLIGLSFKLTASSGNYMACIYLNSDLVDAASVVISKCIFKGAYSGTATYGWGIRSQYVASGGRIAYIVNCLVYDIVNAAETSFNAIECVSGHVFYVYNSTIQNSYYGFKRTAGTFTAKNCLAAGCTDGFNGTITTSYCATSLAESLSGTGDRNSQTFIFVDAGADNFHLASDDGGAKGYGLNLYNDATYPFQEDIDGDDRGGSGAS